jgi:hypothetical protein
MTEQEVLAFLNSDSITEIEGKISSNFFEIKTYLTTRSIIPKLFLAKIKRLQILNEISKSYLGHYQSDSHSSIGNPISFTGIMLEDFNAFHLLKARLCLEIMKSPEIEPCIFLVYELLDLFKKFASNWPLLCDDNLVILAKEIDQMRILTIISEMHKKGIKTYEQLFEMKDILMEDLKYESTRLNILSKQ